MTFPDHFIYPGFPLFPGRWEDCSGHLKVYLTLIYLGTFMCPFICSLRSAVDNLLVDLARVITSEKWCAYSVGRPHVAGSDDAQRGWHTIWHSETTTVWWAYYLTLWNNNSVVSILSDTLKQQQCGEHTIWYSETTTVWWAYSAGKQWRCTTWKRLH